MGPSPKPASSGHDAGMQSSLLADDDLPEPARLVAAVKRRGTTGHYDEWTAAAAGSAPAMPAPAVFKRLLRASSRFAILASDVVRASS